MIRIVSSCFGATLLALGLGASAAQAQSRVFVAAQGSDSNACTFAAPCRTFQHAHDVVAANGEIDVLDPAGYGAVTINKAISIQGHGFSGISTASGNGVTINAGASDAVNLSGLIIEGNGVGTHGIQFSSGGSLVVENCVVRNMSGDGLRLISSASTLQTLSVSNSFFTDNINIGIRIATGGVGAVTAALERVAFYSRTPAGTGLNVIGNGGIGALTVSVTDSIAANIPSGTGFLVQSAAGHSVTTLVLTRVTASENSTGVLAFGPTATAWLAQSTITGNATGFDASGGTILSFGDNYIVNNGANNGVLGSASKQ